MSALGRVLALEHRAVYLYGVLGAQSPLDSGLREVLTARYDAHVEQRDHLVALLAASGADPVEPAIGYPLPSPLSTPADLRAAAGEVERESASSYAYLIAHSDGATRRWAAAVLTASALAQLDVGLVADPFPGLPAT